MRKAVLSISGNVYKQQPEYTLTIKQHKSHAKLQTKIAKKYRQKRRTVYRSEQEPTWEVPL
jgi:hypothetical protein